MTESDLSDVFSEFARVQSIVFHKEKKHAFVKVFTRREAELSKQKFEEMNRTGRLSLRARWGVGFGPRDCSDYQTGISIIPISRLTDADVKWIQHAQVGGTNGQPLSNGVVVEEPDIEIGSGVSSKAISRRMPTNSSKNGPRSTKDDSNSSHNNNNNHRRSSGQSWSNSNSSSPPPPAQSFPNMGGMNGMPGMNGNMPPELATFFANMAQNGGNSMPPGFPMPPQTNQQQNGGNNNGQFPPFPFNPQMAAAFFQQQQQQNPQNQNYQG